MQFPIPVITDGHHRLLAAIAREDLFIHAKYFGMPSLLESLIGITDQVPYEPLEYSSYVH